MVEMWQDDSTSEHKHSLPPEYRVVHLDFKGAPPKVSFLRTLFPLIAAAGANALLMEYEDMFPYHGVLRNLSAKNCYSKSDIKEINRIASQSKLEIIPLVQTFGHLEFVLKLEEFAHLRETYDFPQELCPNHPETMSLIREMLRQVRALHAESRFMHVGCDEVFHLAVCARCSTALRQHEANAASSSMLQSDARFAIFAKHVARVARVVRDELGMVAIMWDDMLRQQGPRLVGSELTGLVEPMVWVYTDDITRLVPHYVWHAYAAVFPNVWVARETALVPNIARHVANTAAWLRVVAGEEVTGRKIRRFRGVVLTGWSRYDHFAVLCELLPAAVPSLIIAIAMLSSGHSSFDEETQLTATKLLGCGSLPDIRAQAEESQLPLLSSASLAADPYQFNVADTCSFPGANVLASMRQLAALHREVDELYTELTERQAWLTAYNVRHGFSSPWRIAEALVKQPFLMSALDSHRNSSQRILSQYLDTSAVNEWLEQRIEPLHRKMSGLQRDARTLMSRTHWPRRPLD
ncbi:hypothetical protein B566_EDAN001494 [Ephemera danica]|nr:hypothetical protein B566_EDAN001494 [Ephemera danica]